MNNVSTIRNGLKMTQEEFADYCEVSRASIARYEAGARVNEVNAKKIAAACNVPASYVMGIDVIVPDMEDDIMMFREHLRRNPNIRVLFSAAVNVKPENMDAAAAMLKALGEKNRSD